MTPVVPLALVALVPAFALAITRSDGAPAAALATLALAATSLTTRARGSFAPRFLGVLIACVALGATRFSPLASAEGTEGAAVITRLLLWFVALGGLTLSWRPPARVMVVGLTVLSAAASLACARSWTRGATLPEERLAALPSVALVEMDHHGVPPSRSVVADGVAVRLNGTYGPPEVCDVAAKRCTKASVWGTNKWSGHKDLADRGTVVRLAWTPRLWILLSHTPRDGLVTIAVDRATMAAVPLHARDLPNPVAAPRAWTWLALGGLALALALGALAAARAHRLRWMLATLPGTLAAGGVLTVLDHTTTTDGLVSPGPVAVRALTVEGGTYRAHVVASDVIEGTPAQAALRWKDALARDLATALMVALVAGAPLIGAGIVGVSAMRP